MRRLQRHSGFFCLLSALIAAALLFAPAARAQIFGGVAADGAVLLTDDPGEGRLATVVADPPAAAPAAAAPGAASPLAAIVAEASRASGVPAQLLRAVIAVESGFNPKAVSSKGALGLMQLMPATARRFSAADPFDPRANILAGAQYLRRLLDRFGGDTELALAAYNAGENAVIRAGYRIPAYAETRAYVPMVMTRYRRFLAGR